MSENRVIGPEVQPDEELEQAQDVNDEELSFTEGEILGIRREGETLKGPDVEPSEEEKAKEDLSSEAPMQTVTTTDPTEGQEEDAVSPSSTVPPCHSVMEGPDVEPGEEEKAKEDLSSEAPMQTVTTTDPTEGQEEDAVSPSSTVPSCHSVMEGPDVEPGEEEKAKEDLSSEAPMQTDTTTESDRTEGQEEDAVSPSSTMPPCHSVMEARQGPISELVTGSYFFPEASAAVTERSEHSMTVKHSGEAGAVKEDEVKPSGEQEEEEEEHSQTTSPTPTKLGSYFFPEASAAVTEWSEHSMTVKHSEEEDEVKEDEVKPSGEQQQQEEEHSQTTQGHDAISESKLGEPSRRPGKEIMQGSDDQLPTNRTRVDGSRRRIFLFEVRLNRRDLHQGRVFIPLEIAVDHFPPLPKRHQRAYEEKIKVTDAQDRDWIMTIKYDPSESAFLLNSEWQSFSERHDLKPTDVVRFYSPIPRSHEQHYLIEYLQERKQLEVTGAHIEYGRLIIPTQEVRNHFKAVRIPCDTHTVERLYFTDATNKEWCMKLIFYFETYMVIEGWEEFVKGWHVKPGDVIMFYRPVRPLDSRHFLIANLSGGGRSEASGSPSRLGTSALTTEGIGEEGIRSIVNALADLNLEDSTSGGRRRKKKCSFVQCCMS